MEVLNKIITLKISRLLSDPKLLSSFNFSVLCFFVFLGTDIPFNDRVDDPYEAETTNIINQIVYIFLFFSSSYVFLIKYKNLIRIIRREKILSLFILFCLLSFIWSDYPLISFKRSFQLAISFITILNTALLLSNYKINMIILSISYIYLISNYVSGIFIPQAIDPSFGTWRGIEIHKNLLGYSSLMLFIFFLILIYEKNIKTSAFIIYIGLFLSGGLIILSFSTTNIIGMIVVLLVFYLKILTRNFEVLGIRKFLFYFLLSIILLLGVIVILFSKELLALIPSIFGKDPSFTGRDIIWIYILGEIQKRPLIGYGYGTYWIMGTHIIDLFTAFVGWRVNEAHNGFLEILLQLGITGFLLYLIILVKYIRNFIKYNNLPALLLLLGIIIVNFSESFIFTPRDISTILFMLFYLKLFMNEISFNE